MTCQANCLARVITAAWKPASESGKLLGSAHVRILLTAFEAYEQWSENSSWLTLIELLKDRIHHGNLVTRRYPVDLPCLRERLYHDLQIGFDTVLHLGQSPGSPNIKLEMLAVNFAGRVENDGQELGVIVEDGPLAYRTQLPMGRWAAMLRQQDIPTSVSYHAGTFLCNATMYLSLHYGQRLAKCPNVGFIHLPLTTQQVVQSSTTLPCLPVQTLARAVRLLLDDLSQSEPESLNLPADWAAVGEPVVNSSSTA